MKRTVLLLSMATLMIAGALGHVFATEMYSPMIPDFINSTLAHVVSVLLEIGIGIALLHPKYRHVGGLGFMLLMLGFLPIHIWDVFRETPAIGPFPAAAIRLVFQFILIYLGYWVFKTYRAST